MLKQWGKNNNNLFIKHQFLDKHLHTHIQRRNWNFSSKNFKVTERESKKGKMKIDFPKVCCYMVAKLYLYFSPNKKTFQGYPSFLLNNWKDILLFWFLFPTQKLSMVVTISTHFFWVPNINFPQCYTINTYFPTYKRVLIEQHGNQILNFNSFFS